MKPLTKAGIILWALAVLLLSARTLDAQQVDTVTVIVPGDTIQLPPIILPPRTITVLVPRAPDVVPPDTTPTPISAPYAKVIGVTADNVLIEVAVNVHPEAARYSMYATPGDDSGGVKASTTGTDTLVTLAVQRGSADDSVKVGANARRTATCSPAPSNNCLIPGSEIHGGAFPVLFQIPAKDAGGGGGNVLGPVVSDSIWIHPREAEVALGDSLQLTAGVWDDGRRYFWEPVQNLWAGVNISGGFICLTTERRDGEGITNGGPTPPACSGGGEGT